MTLSEWLRDAEARLMMAAVPDARLEARVLAAHVLDLDRPAIVAHGEATVSPEMLETAIARRLNREPLAYIVGFREFYSRPFRVNHHVLIPRPETELLVDEALRLVDIGGARILDLCSGSGCIGITLALERPSWSVTLSDISCAAMETAKENARALGAHVECQVGDLLAPHSGQAFDAIVCNPPYVAEGTPLMPEVGIFEPELALYGGETGLEVYERLADTASRNLVEGGLLLLELGTGQEVEVQELFEHSGWRQLSLVSDLSGIPRVLTVSPKSVHN